MRVSDIINDNLRSEDSGFTYYRINGHDGFDVSRLKFNDGSESGYFIEAPHGKHNLGVFGKVDSDASLEINNDRMVVESKGRKLSFDTFYSPLCRIRDARGVVQDIVKNRLEDCDLESKNIVINLHHNNSLLLSTTINKDSLEVDNPIFDCDVQSEHIKMYDYVVEGDTAICNLVLFGSAYSIYPTISSLGAFIHLHFSSNLDHTYTSSTYPFLRAYETSNGFRVEFVDGGDFIEGMADDEVNITSYGLNLTFNNKKERFTIFFNEEK